MPKVVATIQVEDLVEWEKGFLTHGDLFRRQTINGRYDYTMIEDGNRVVLCADVDDIDTFFDVLDTLEGSDAKDMDGVKRETIQFYVLDKKFTF